MTAWPAAKELRLEGVVEGLVGLCVLVVALTTGADYLWLAGVVVAVLLASTVWRLRVEARALARAEPLPADTRPPTRWQLLGRVPMAFVSALCTACVAFIFPPFLFLTVALLFGVALLAFARATAITRWERAHGGRIVRVREDTFGPEQYFVVSHSGH
ncbi:hypothetical protein OJ997_23745 [Solirubrobacter phytolaccae]|uniref:Uncharacterized protein n=1 Tax=Solirubrobacter phytolaccae TaxID=1404360 RepID=A0A9X3NC18_9ACTN|nr:hypothetical protein [Solirubrobacter phytolaccae]MDA0183344.1 hypothetical protein [Solirubrobacter phytolaccae]